MFWLALIWILLLLCGGLWVMATGGRRNHPKWAVFRRFRYAHRGLHDREAGIPENSLPAFRRALERGYGVELDVHLTGDGRLAVIHDKNLKRTAGVDAEVSGLSAAELKTFRLEGTGETIPLLEEVLPVFAGKTPLIVELKVAGNADALVDAAMARLEGYPGLYCVESFHPAALLALKKRYPWVIRGQLSENFFRGSETGLLSRPSAAVMTLLLTTSATRPDFIAYHYMDRACPSLRLMKRLYGVHEVAWTVRSREDMELLEQEGVTVIFEGFVP